MAVIGRHGVKAGNVTGNTSRRNIGHHRQKSFQDGINPDNRCHTGARSRHFGKGIELSEEEATFDDGNTETVSRPTQVPEDKLDETFTSIPPSELEYGEDEPEDEEPDKKQASGSSFEDIDMAVHTIRKESPSDEEMRHAGKVMTELDGTELFTRITERLTDEAMSERLAKAMAVFVDTVNMTVTQQKERCS